MRFANVRPLMRAPNKYKENIGMASDAVLTVTDENFTDEIEGSSGLAMVDFWAVWCMPCRIVAPAIEELAEQYRGQLTVGKLDVDSNHAVASKYGVRAIPSILFFKDGRHVDTVVGAVPKRQLENKIQEYLITN